MVAAAGNSQSALDYPATLPGVLAVGASNPWGRGKTRRSRDGEHWWGSSHGRLDAAAALALAAVSAGD